MLTDNHKKLLSVLIFLMSFSFLVLFMYNFIGGAQLNFIPFWIAILGIVIPIIYQIYRVNLNSSTKSLIFIEIASIILLLNLIQLMLQRYLLTLGGDAYLLLVSANRIENTSHFLTATGFSIDQWPYLQLVSKAISKISGISLYDVALFSPIFYQILAVLFLYLFAAELYSERVGLLACTFFAFFHLFSQMNSFFRPETLAFVFLFAYLTFMVKRPENTVVSFLALLFMLSIVLTHYTTSAILLCFLVVMLLGLAFLRLLNSKRQLVRGLSLEEVSIRTALASVATFGYWMYVGKLTFQLMAQIVLELYEPQALSLEQMGYIPRVPLLKETIILRTNAFYIALFVGLMLYEIVKRRGCKNWQTDFWLACWAGATFIFWLLGEQYPQILPSYRIFLFSYPFVLILVSHIINEMSSAWKRNLFVILLIGFVLLNVLAIEIIPLNPLSHSSPFPFSNWDTTQDFQAANWEGAGTGAAVASGAMTSLLQYTKGLEPSLIGESIEYFGGDLERLRAFSWLYLEPDAPGLVRTAGFARVTVRLSKEVIFKISDTPWLQKVYTNEEWDIYRITP